VGFILSRFARAQIISGWQTRGSLRLSSRRSRIQGRRWQTGGWLLSLASAKREVTKEKAAPGSPPLTWCPCVTRQARRLWNSLAK
jgi:hypothetical protein